MEYVSFPIDLFPKLLTYIKVKDWFYIIFFNKEVFNICRPTIYKTRAMYKLKPHLLRFHSCFLARKLFINRIEEDIGFRRKYLYIHEPRNGPTHICWHRIPPSCLTVRDGLEELLRLIAGELERTQSILIGFEPEQYQWLLDNVRIVDGVLQVRI